MITAALIPVSRFPQCACDVVADAVENLRRRPNLLDSCVDGLAVWQLRPDRSDIYHDRW
jgi:hypothetical protein